MNEISKILHDDERVLWEGRPQKSPYVVDTIIATMPGVVLAAFLTPFLYSFLSGPFQWEALLVLSPFSLMALVLLFGAPIYRILLYPHLRYAVTDKRFVLQKGVVGRDFDSVNHDKIENASVNVGVVDKLFGKNSGTVLVYTNRITSAGKHGSKSAPFKLVHVTDPYEVFENLKDVSLDVRADIEFPNAIRPEENKGYGTEYQEGNK